MITPKTTAVPTPRSTGHPRRWLILALVLVAECMDLLDGTIVNVAAPTISRDLNASASDLQWVIGGYALAFAIVLITGARLGDRYGRKRLFVIGAFGFVAASMLCGLAQSSGMLITTRLLQGSAAALLIPQGLGIVRDAFDPDDRATAFALFGPVIGLSAVLGPILGGLLVNGDLFGTGWRLVFYINLPLGLIAALGAARVMRESLAPVRQRLDVIGTALIAATTGLIIYPLIQGRQDGWPAWTYVSMACSAVALGLLVLWLRRAGRTGRDPVIETSMLTHRGYSAGLAMILVFFAGMIGTLLCLTLYLQFGQHYTAVRAGLTIAPFALGSAVGAAIAMALLVERLGRVTLQIGCVVLAAGGLWLREVFGSHGLQTHSLDVLLPQLVLGIGIGVLVAPLFDFALSPVSDTEAGSASGLLNAVQQLAGALGVAVLGTIFYTVLAHSGFVAAIRTALLVEVATMPALVLLAQLLPMHSRVIPEPDAAPEPVRTKALVA